MTTKKTVIQLIFDAIDEINEQLPEEQQLTKSVDMVLFGESGSLDSLGLVNFIVTIEQALEDHFDICVTLADEKAMSLKNSPFRTVETLGEYICKRLEEKLQ
jgi:acyl carrier protein